MREPDDVAWERGQLWSYRMLDGKNVIFRVAAVDPNYGIALSPLVELLDVVFDDEPPNAEVLARAPLRAVRAGFETSESALGLAPEHLSHPMFQPCVKRVGELPGRRLKELRAAGTPRPATADTKTVGVPWHAVDNFLADVFQLGSLRQGAILEWPISSGGSAYTIVEVGEHPSTLASPQWQLAVLDCWGRDVAMSTIESAEPRARLLVRGFLPAGLFREVAFRQLEWLDEHVGEAVSWTRAAELLQDPGAIPGFESAAPEAGTEQAVIVGFEYAAKSVDPLFELEARLEQAIVAAGVGVFDGNEIATDLSDGSLYMYGPDAEALFRVVRPLLVEASCFRSAVATLEFDPNGVQARTEKLR